MTDANGCRVWIKNRSKKGYGRINIAGRIFHAHRVAWTAERGEIPGGLFVCHKCDNPPCCNVDHLFLGTPADNTADMMRKGRNRMKPPKYSDHLGRLALFATISGHTQREIGLGLGISQQMVSKLAFAAREGLRP